MSPQDPRSVAELRATLANARGTSLRDLVRQLESDDRPGVRAAVARALNGERARDRERARLKRLYALQEQLAQEGLTLVVGVDEVGRGALAGPLTAGACILPLKPRITGLDDSKRLTPARREELAHHIRVTAIAWSVAHAAPAEVDALGITSALRQVMGRALEGLDARWDHVVIDGLPLGVVARETAVVGGDGKVAAIAAASILAKVTRDALMVDIAADHSHFAFEVNKGYGTAEHLAALAAHGPCAVHRLSFLPCRGTERLF